jgi:folate-binding protein YgfZ
MPNALAPVAATATPDAAVVAARDSAVVCDLAPIAVLAIGGADATAFLHGQLSIDVQRLASGAFRYATYNSPKGRMLATLVLWRAGADDYRALVPGDIAEAVRKRLAMFVLRSKVALSDVTAGHARRCGRARATGRCARCSASLRAARGRAGRPCDGAGPRWIAVRRPPSNMARHCEHLRKHLAEGDFAVWQWHHPRASDRTASTQDAFVAQAADMDILGAIDFSKNSTGQEVIARMQYLGRLKERAFLFTPMAPASRQAPACSTRIRRRPAAPW